jgi:hypothetical protein
MKRLLIALFVLAVTALPLLAADPSSDMTRTTPDTNMTPPDMNMTAPDSNLTTPDMNMTAPDMSGMEHGMAPGAEMKAPGKMMHRHPEMKEMMRNPAFLLVMAYHRNLVTFAHMLDKVAHQGETVPREFARTSIAEMRRSTDEMEKYRAEAMAAMPAAMKDAEMQKKMDEHLVAVKLHLRELESLAKQDRIPSQDVMNQLQFIFKGCEGMDCSMMMHEKKPMRGCGCDKMMPERRRMMEEVMNKLKAQDAALAQKTDAMNQAPMDDKLKLLADVVTLMVQQRAAMTADMEKMQKRMMHHPQMMKGMEQGEDDEDMDADTDDDMNMQDMNMHHMDK